MGAVAEMATMSEVTSVTTMYSCLSCHEMNHAKASCGHLPQALIEPRVF